MRLLTADLENHLSTITYLHRNLRYLKYLLMILFFWKYCGWMQRCFVLFRIF